MRRDVEIDTAVFVCMSVHIYVYTFFLASPPNVGQGRYKMGIF